MASLGPATGLPAVLVRARVLLCCGEDRRELEGALAAGGRGPPTPAFSYRCYRAWAWPDRLAVWTGIGTGCLEPLLWELLRTGCVEEIVLVGTAGGLPGSRAPAGEPHLLAPALDGHPRLDGVPPEGHEPTWTGDLPRSAVVSTDIFYGFSPRCLDDYPASPELQEAWAHHRSRDALVDMETAPFYHFCHTFDATGALRYGAVKAAANPVDDPDSLPDRSGAALAACVAAVLDAE